MLLAPTLLLFTMTVEGSDRSCGNATWCGVGILQSALASRQSAVPDGTHRVLLAG
jgi:hypothetical protein